MRGRRLVVGLALAGLALAACGGTGADAPSADQTPQSTVGETEQAVPEGEPAPSVTFETFEDGQASLSDFYGEKPLVVNFWASWCPPCVTEMPDIEEVHQQFGDRTNFLGINTQDERAEAERLVDETGVSYPLALDPEGRIFQAFGVFGMPSTFFVDEQGRIVERHTGLLTKDALVEMIRTELLGGAG